MYPTNMYVRAATDDDESALLRLAELDSSAPLTGRVLVAEIAGAPAAALSMSDGRVIADPFQRTAHLAAMLRIRANADQAYASVPSLRDRIAAALAPARRHALPRAA